MAEPYLAEIRMFGGNFAPRQWAFCDGQILPINQNQSLYSLLGTTYGGDGRTTFALPDLRGRTPMHVGTGFQLGQRGGEERHVLTEAEIPSHTHPVVGNQQRARLSIPTGAVFAEHRDDAGYATTNDDSADARAVQAGSGQSHDNMAPFAVVHFIIALSGLFPPRN